MVGRFVVIGDEVSLGEGSRPEEGSVDCELLAVRGNDLAEYAVDDDVEEDAVRTGRAGKANGGN